LRLWLMTRLSTKPRQLSAAAHRQRSRTSLWLNR